MENYQEVMSAIDAVGYDEPILTETDRGITLDIEYQDLWEMYQKQLSCFWTINEIPLKDEADLEKLSEGAKKFLYHILSFFLVSDKIVGDNLVEKFYSEVKIPEAEKFYGCQIMMENIHHEMYSKLIKAYIKEPDERNKYLNGVQNIVSVKHKAEWAMKWINSKNTFAERLVAFAIVEGIFFSGSFCAIFWLKKQGLMPGLTLSNEFISRDEGLHTQFACMLYSKLMNKLDKFRVIEIMMEAVEIEKEFITESLDVKLIGMNAKDMKQYIEYVADRLFFDLGFTDKEDKIYGSSNPFDWMNLIGIPQKTNFFESRVSSYQKSGVKEESRDFNMMNDF
jgi:ribonucleoside-diphosphate reductase beta chain